MKQFLASFFFCCLSCLLSAQAPVNDDCDGLIDLGVAPYCPDISVAEVFTNLDATASDIGFGNSPSCFNGGTTQQDVWFAFTTSDTIFDYTITLTGVTDPGITSIVNPQIALYRGDCTVDGLAELLCASAELGETTLELDAMGLTPNVTYFIRINDYSATGSPNSGSFILCVDEQEPVNIIDEGGSTACSGELYDSGGPDGDYENNENFTYTICPSQPNQCINFSLQYYSLEHSDFGVLDQLLFYDGDEAVPGNLIASIGGSDFATEISNGGGVCQVIQASSGCMTIQFISDGTNSFEGFAGFWECSSQACDPITPITVDPTAGELDIVDALSTPQTQITITDINCSDAAYGVFEAGDNSDLGLEKGLLLATGNATYAVGPNNSAGNFDGDLFLPGDADLDTLSLQSGNFNASQDACVLELDVLASTDELTFEYIFGSEEYTEYVGQNLNDIFAFLVSGPGIVGDPSIGNQLNIATLPNPAQTAIEINSVNNDQNWEYFRSNELGQSVQYDGLTSDYLGVKKSLTARTEVIPCSTYHLKLAIADRGDGVFDSGVFISEIRGGTPDIAVMFNSGVDYLIEDCTDEPDDLVIRLNSAVEDTVSYTINVGGTATPLVDYLLTLPNIITFLPGETEFTFPVSVLSDFDNTEGIETIEISLTNDFGCGEVTYTTLTIELHDELNVLINAGQDTTRLCVGASVGLDADGAAQYFWTPVPIFDNPTSPSPTVTPAASGWVQVTGQILDCIDTDSVYLEIIDPQIEITTNDETEICRGDVITMTAENNTSSEGLTWSPEVGVSDVNAQSPVFAPEVPTLYIATIEIAGCAVSDTMEVDVDFLNVPELINDTLICQNYAVQLGTLIDQDTTTSMYFWTPTGSLNDSSIPDPIATPGITTTYELITMVANEACADTSSLTVTVTPANVEIVPAVDTVFICLGESVDLTAITSTGNANNFSWSPNDGSLSTTTDLATIATPTETTQYLTTFEVAQCIVFDSLIVYVDSLPTDLGLMIDPIEDPYCPGDLVFLTSPTYEPANFAGIEHQWITIGEETGDSLYNLVLTTVDTFTYQRITSLGACVDTAEVTLNVITPEDLSIIPGDQTICEGESVNFMLLSGDDLDEIEWTPEAGLSCTDCENPTASPGSTTTYNVEAEVFGCPVFASATVTVNQLPNIDVIDNMQVCAIEGTSFTLNDNGAETGTTYSWTSPDDPTFTNDQAQPEVTPTTTTTYQLVATNSCGESTGQTTITVIPQATLMAVEDSITVCIENSFTVSSIVTNGGGVAENYTWQYDGESNLGAETTFTATNPGWAYISYTYGAPIPAGCEILEDSVYINVLNNSYSVTIETDPAGLTEVYQGSGFILNAIVDPPIGLDYSYNWTGPETISTPNEQSTEVTAPFELEGEQTYFVDVSIPEGCLESAALDLEILKAEVKIPNVFSPNNDGVNDFFHLYTAGEVEDYSCMIYNRWGQVVFESTELAEFWDGTYNDEDAPSEVYAYVFKFRVGGKTFEETGDVTLIR